MAENGVTTAVETAQQLTTGDWISAAIELVVCLLTLFAMGRMFKKAGFPAYAAWIPFYNVYVIYQIAWKKNAFTRTFLYILLGIVGFLLVSAGVFNSMWLILSGLSFLFLYLIVFVFFLSGDLLWEPDWGVLLKPEGYIIDIGLILIAISIIALLVHLIRLNLRVAQSFGKGKMFGWGLFLFGPVFWIILGFSKNEYLGPIQKLRSSADEELDDPAADVDEIIE